LVFFFSSRRRHTRFSRDWSSDVCSSDLSLAYIELRNAVDRILAGVIDVYTHLLVICLRRRYFVGLGFVILLMAGGAAGAFGLLQIGRASCRERVLISSGAGSLKGNSKVA